MAAVVVAEVDPRNTSMENQAEVISSVEGVCNTKTAQDPDALYDVNNMTSEEVYVEKKSIYKNLLVICISFLLLFIAFESMAKLQSSINAANGNVGTWANALIYMSLIVSSSFLPCILIKKFKAKWTLCGSMFCYTAYMVAQFHPEFYTLLPTAIILGAGAAPLWSSKCSYLTQISHRLAEIEGTAVEAQVTKFFGIFFFFFQCNSIIGQGISTAVFSIGAESEFNDDDMAVCGAGFCPGDVNRNANFSVSKGKVYILATIYLICSVGAALLVGLFLDPLSRYGGGKRDVNNLEGWQLVTATFQQMKSKKQQLIIPLTFFSGVEQGFFTADFTGSFVTCAYGVQTVGRVIVCYGVCDAISSATMGYMIKIFGREKIFSFAAVLNVICMIIAFSWRLTGFSAYVAYLVACMWGMSDGIWQTQVNALYGILFPSNAEAAFSNYRLWESLGFVVAFITAAANVCAEPKMIFVCFVLVAGLAGYFACEKLIWDEEREAREARIVKDKKKVAVKPVEGSQDAVFN